MLVILFIICLLPYNLYYRLINIDRLCSIRSLEFDERVVNFSVDFSSPVLGFGQRKRENETAPRLRGGKLFQLSPLSNSFYPPQFMTQFTNLLNGTFDTMMLVFITNGTNFSIQSRGGLRTTPLFLPIPIMRFTILIYQIYIFHKFKQIWLLKSFNHARIANRRMSASSKKSSPYNCPQAA